MTRRLRSGSGARVMVAWMIGAGLLSAALASPTAHAQGDAPAGGGALDADHVGAALRGEAEPVAEARASADLPAGTILVTVVDESGAAVAGAAVELGVMGQGGKREKKQARTGASGEARFEGLPVGSVQAYRVNVPLEGAVYSSNPFQLPPAVGYAVRVRRLPVSTDARFLLQFLLRVYVELKDGRVQVVEQAQLMNLGKGTYVFPKDGLEVVLPEGHLAFQTQATMGDQRLVESEKGFRMFGSVPPGRTNLLWAFDLPLEGTEVAFVHPVPLRTYRFSIEADAPPGAKLDVEGMPAAIHHEENGKKFLVVQEQRDLGAAPLAELRVRLHGLPGPGPTRWIATGLALAFVLLGGWFWLRPAAAGPEASAEALKAEKDSLLADAEALEAEFRRGEVGPKYREERLREITSALALVLKHEAGQRPER